MKFEDVLKRAVEVRAKYDELNKSRGVTWNDQDIMAGFVGDIGDLSKIIMAKHGLRRMDDVDARLAHELSDCLWVVCVLADKYDIDLAREFQETMDVLEKRIGNERHADGKLKGK